MVFRTHKQRPRYRHPVQAPKTAPRFIPIPEPQPADCTLALTTILGAQRISAIQAAGQIVFHSVGDTGGINGTDAQDAVAEAMETGFAAKPISTDPAFFYHLGDVIYYNGQSELYDAEFYEPYKYYPAVIFAIPGNHDGDTVVESGDLPDSEPSLQGFFTNFCAAQSTAINAYRDSMIQPYAYWMLEAPFVTIIGLYANVDGTLDAPGSTTQQDWFVAQLKQVDPATCLIVAVHQPPYSLDKMHSGYPAVNSAIDQAAQETGIWPHAVFSGHVHNFQRFTRTVGTTSIPYIIAGSGGYAHTSKALHKMQRDANQDPVQVPLQTTYANVELRSYNEVDSGFMRVTVDATHLTVDFFAVPFTGTPVTIPFDTMVLNHRTRAIESDTTSAGPY